MSKLLSWWRETLLHAYLCGLYERTRWGDGFGRTHELNQDWNEAYDTGANHADWFNEIMQGVAT